MTAAGPGPLAAASAPGPLLAWDVADGGIAVGFVLAAVPLILYLLERRRTPVVDWPAMRFFLPDLKRSIRRMRLREAVLILLRSLVLAGLVAALMRPGETRRRPAAERDGGSRGVVILLDNSYSMAARAGGGRGPSRWDAARAAADDVLAGLLPGDLVQVATFAGKPAALTGAPMRSLADARAAVREAALAGGGASVLDALDLAADLARALPVPSREVVLITDLAESGWSPGDEGRLAFVKARLGSLTPAPGVAVLDVGEEDASNRAVVGLELSRPMVGTDRAVEIDARVAQFGDPAPRSLEAVLKVDGEERESRSVQVAEGAPGRVRFRHRFTAAGPHQVEVHLRGSADGLAEDDVRRLAISAEERLAVLIVAGGSGGSRESSLDGDGDLLDLALAPRARGIPIPEVLFRPTVMGEREFEDIRSADLLGYRVVILADPASLDPAPARLLEDWVRSGGGLLIFAGEKASAPAYNQDLFRGGRGVLPARLAAFEGGPEGAGGLRLPGGMAESHPALAAFGEALRPELGKVQVRRSWRTEAAPPGTTAIAELATGAPFLLEKQLGRGRVVLAASSARLVDSDLPRRPLFVPLVHGLVLHLASAAEDRRSLLLGESLLLGLEGAEPGGTAVVEDPGGASHAVPIETMAGDSAGMGARAALRYGPLGLPGFYAVKVRTRTGERPFVFAADMDPRESNLKRLDPRERERIAGVLGLSLARKAADLGPGPAGTDRREWWRPILGAVLALLLVEVLVARAFAKGRAPWRPGLPGI